MILSDEFKMLKNTNEQTMADKVQRRELRRAEKKSLKTYRLLWDSKRQGTYIKKLHGELR